MAFSPRSTKEVGYKTLVRLKLEYAAPIRSPHIKLRFNRWRRYRGQQLIGPAASSVGEMLDEL